MSSEATTMGAFQTAFVRECEKWSAKLAHGENLLISVALATMVILPLSEALLRRTFHVSIPGSIAIVQHMVLVVSNHLNPYFSERPAEK